MEASRAPAPSITTTDRYPGFDWSPLQHATYTRPAASTATPHGMVSMPWPMVPAQRRAAAAVKHLPSQICTNQKKTIKIQFLKINARNMGKGGKRKAEGGTKSDFAQSFFRIGEQ